MKKIIVVTSSPRKNGNSETLARKFAQGSAFSGNDVQFIAIRDLNLQFCTGCMYCKTHDKCVLNDGMNALYHQFENADVIAFATPVYYYAACGQLKTFLDRLNPLYPRKNKFRDVYLIATCADDVESAMDGAVKDIQGWIDCFENVSLKGVLRAINLEEKGAVEGTAYLEQAYEMGKNA